MYLIWICQRSQWKRQEGDYWLKWVVAALYLLRRSHLFRCQLPSIRFKTYCQTLKVCYCRHLGSPAFYTALLYFLFFIFCYTEGKTWTSWFTSLYPYNKGVEGGSGWTRLKINRPHGTLWSKANAPATRHGSQQNPWAEEKSESRGEIWEQTIHERTESSPSAEKGWSWSAGNPWE